MFTLILLLTEKKIIDVFDENWLNLTNNCVNLRSNLAIKSIFGILDCFLIFVYFSKTLPLWPSPFPLTIHFTHYLIQRLLNIFFCLKNDT